MTITETEYNKIDLTTESKQGRVAAAKMLMRLFHIERLLHSLYFS